MRAIVIFLVLAISLFCSGFFAYFSQSSDFLAHAFIRRVVSSAVQPGAILFGLQ
jgi:hypothetical protein